MKFLKEITIDAGSEDPSNESKSPENQKDEPE